MKARVILLVVAAAFIAIGAWSISRRGRRAPTAKPDVAIQDGKTIDFSSGQPRVKEDKATIDRSVSEMDAAAANVTFTAKPAGAASTPSASAGSATTK